MTGIGSSDRLLQADVSLPGLWTTMAVSLASPGSTDPVPTGCWRLVADEVPAAVLFLEELLVPSVETR